MSRYRFLTLLIALLVPSLTAAGKPGLSSPIPTRTLKEGDAKIHHLSDRDVATIHIHPGGSILSFPAKPTKVIIGREQQFDVQYVEQDVAIVALSPVASANMFVYMLGRRYAFNLVATAGKGERIIMIRDPKDNRVEVEVR